MLQPPCRGGLLQLQTHMQQQESKVSRREPSNFLLPKLTVAQRYRDLCTTRRTITARNVLFLIVGALLALPAVLTQTSPSDELYILPTPALNVAKRELPSTFDAVLEKHNSMVATEAISELSERIGAIDSPHWQIEKQYGSRTEKSSKDEKLPRMVSGNANELNNGAAGNHTDLEQADIIDDFLDEARYNLATRVMSNGVEVIIASDKIKTQLAGADVATEIATKDAPQQQHHQLQLRVVPSQAIYRPLTLAASTLKNQMILVMPSQNTEPVNFSIPVDLNQFVTKICLTTYTYHTTYLQDGSTTVESQEQVISNIATEERNYFRMTPTVSLGVTLTRTPALAIGIFPTTYSYYNTIMDANPPLAQTSKRTIINTITGPDDYINFLQPSEEATPAHETNTYYSKLTFTNTLHSAGVEKLITTTHMLTQVIVTESLPPRSTTLLATKVGHFNAYGELNVTNTMPIKNNIAGTSQILIASPLHSEYDIHIYTTKTFVTTFTYFKTSLLSASTAAETSLKDLVPTTRNTRIVENVITEAVPNSLINSELVSKFRAELKNGKHERRVIITTASLLSGQTLEITAMRVLKPPMKTASLQNQTNGEPTKAAGGLKISPTTVFINLNQKFTRFTKANHSIVSTIPTKIMTGSATTEPTAQKHKDPVTTKYPFETPVSTRPPESILADETSFDESDANNVEEVNGGGDTLTADSEYDAVYVSKSPTLEKPSNPQKQQHIENNNPTHNKNRLPVAVNQIIGSLNFHRLTALRPVFNAMAGLLQSNFQTTLNQKNVSSMHQTQQHLHQMSNSPIQLSVPAAAPALGAAVLPNGVGAVKFDNITDTESRHHIESSTAKKQEPIYIPVKDAGFAVDSRRQQSVTAAAEYATDLLDTSSAQSLHIKPPKADITISDDEESKLLLRTANDIYPQQLAQLANRQRQGDKNGFETSLINGGIPIRPGEVITANSDVIIGKPNGIQYPLMPVPKRNSIENKLQQQPQAYGDNFTPIGSQMGTIQLLEGQKTHYASAVDYQQQQMLPQTAANPHSHIAIHRQQHQENENHSPQIKHGPNENYDNILRPPPVVSLKLATKTMVPLSPPPMLPPPTSTNSYIAYAESFGLLSPPALPTSPTLPSNNPYASSNPASYVAPSQVHTFTNERNENLANIPKAHAGYYAENYSKTRPFGEKLIAGNKAPNLYDITVYTPAQSIDYYQKHTRTPQLSNIGSALAGGSNTAQHQQDDMSKAEFSSYSYSALNATYDTIRSGGGAVESALGDHVPIGSPSNHQKINLHTHVFSHNVNMHAPPLTFKKESEYPTHASAVHGQIPSNAVGPGPRLPFTIANMPHIKIQPNEKQVQVNLTPENVIGQINKPDAHSKGAVSIYVESPSTTYGSETTSNSAVVGSFSLDNSLPDYLETPQRPVKLVPKTQKYNNYPQLYVMMNGNRADFRDDIEDVNSFHQMLIPASSATVQNILANGNPVTPAQLTLSSAVIRQVQDSAANGHTAGNVNAVASDINTGAIYYEHDDTINEVESSSNVNDYKDAVADDDYNGGSKPHIEDKAEATSHASVPDVRADQRTASATNSLHKQIKTKQQQLIHSIRSEDTIAHKNKQVSHSTPPHKLLVQQWQRKSSQHHILHPFLSPNSALEVNDLHGTYDQSPTAMTPIANEKQNQVPTSASNAQTVTEQRRPTTYYVSSGTKLDTYINSAPTSPTTKNVNNKVKSLLHSHLLLRGVPFTAETTPALQIHSSQQPPTQTVFVAKGEGFRLPEIGGDEIFVSLDANSASTRAPYIVGEYKHVHTTANAPSKVKANSYTSTAVIPMTTPEPIKTGSSSKSAQKSPPPSSLQAAEQSIYFFGNSVTQPQATPRPLKVEDFHTITAYSTSTTAMPSSPQAVSHGHHESTPSDMSYAEQGNRDRKHSNRVNESLWREPAEADKKQRISNSNISKYGYQQSPANRVVGLNPPPSPPAAPGQQPLLILLAPVKLKSSGSSSMSTHVYNNTINSKTMWQPPLQPPLQPPPSQPPAPTEHDVTYIPRIPEGRPVKQPKPIPTTKADTARNTTMHQGGSTKSKSTSALETIMAGNGNYFDDKTAIIKPTRSNFLQETTSPGAAPSDSLIESVNTLRTVEEFTHNKAVAKPTKSKTMAQQSGHQQRHREKIQAEKTSASTTLLNEDQLKLYRTPLLESSESTAVVAVNTMSSSSNPQTKLLHNKGSSKIIEIANQAAPGSFNNLPNQRIKQRLQEQRQQFTNKAESFPQNTSLKRIILLPTKYITRTQLLTVTTTRSTVVLTTANEQLQSKYFMVTRTQTETVINTITHTEWATETETETAIEVATKTKTKTQIRTLIQPTRITEAHIILATTTTTKIETETIAPEKNLVDKFATTTATAVSVESTDSHTQIIYSNLYQNHKPSNDFRKPQLQHEHENFADEINSNRNNHRDYERVQISEQAAAVEESAADTTTRPPPTIPSEAIPNDTSALGKMDEITPNNSIFIVMTNSQNGGGKRKPLTDIVSDGTLSGVSDISSGSGIDTNAATIDMDYDDNLSVFSLPTRDEESVAIHHDLHKIPSQVLLGGVLIASPPKLLSGYDSTVISEVAYEATVTACQLTCKLSRNEVCALTDLRWRCVCRPGFARMFPDRPCKPTYTYAMRIQTERIGNYMLLYNSALGDNSTDEYMQLATITKEAVDRMVMQSDFRDIYHGVKLTTFTPVEASIAANDDDDWKQPPKRVSANFLLQLSENSDEKRLAGVFKKYLRLSNYSIGGTELFTNRNGVESLAIIDFDECVYIQFHDCSPNARCFNLQGTYTCSCKEGFADLSGNSIYPGRMCSQELIGCDQCHYHGKCVATKAVENTVCECFAWYTGAKCQVNLKILLIALISVGTFLLTLLMFCILLMCTKRNSLRHRARQLSPAGSGIHRIISAKNTALAGIGLIGRHSAHDTSGGRSNLDKCAIIKDTSSESSQNSLSYLLQKESTTRTKKSHHRFRHPDTKTDNSIQAEEQRHSTYDRLPLTECFTTNTNGSGKYLMKTHNLFTDLERNYPDQSDRSLTVMIPRAKYHASVLPQPQLFHQQVNMEQSKKPHEQLQRMKQKQVQINKSDNTASMTTMQEDICGVLVVVLPHVVEK
ncbi:PREDICTED: uncharacterized protein LOC108377602 isoform X2 [Rhagoletis zephyria]|uniref:uncharacterized protein LOC108377602 isoform X2 n=1 Tax=Rhagoletis zephyria TaxID=28612 RepID=UPI0008112553|nr:PREDICTED: uncharacterized protein LOC108377602 isoform X2 [Rhagoletis zephyria]